MVFRTNECPKCGLWCTNSDKCERCGTPLGKPLEEITEATSGYCKRCGAHMFDGICGWCYWKEGEPIEKPKTNKRKGTKGRQ